VTPPKAPAWRCARCLRQRPYAVRRGLRPICVRCAADLAARGRKWCGACGRALLLEAFAANGRGGQRRGTCRACDGPHRRILTAAASRRWRAAHPEHTRAYKRDYMARNREKGRRWARAGAIRKKLRILRGEA
jgi:hypothetical protein